MRGWNAWTSASDKDAHNDKDVLVTWNLQGGQGLLAASILLQHRCFYLTPCCFYLTPTSNPSVHLDVPRFHVTRTSSFQLTTTANLQVNSHIGIFDHHAFFSRNWFTSWRQIGEKMRDNLPTIFPEFGLCTRTNLNTGRRSNCNFPRIYSPFHSFFQFVGTNFPENFGFFLECSAKYPLLFFLLFSRGSRLFCALRRPPPPGLLLFAPGWRRVP